MGARRTLSRADALERFSPKAVTPSGTRWPRSESQFDCPHLLFADGFDSTSDGADAWAGDLAQRCFPNEAIPPVRTFSYRFPGTHYDRRETWDSLDRYIAVWKRHLPQDRGEVIPVGFSHGGNISLIAAAKALSEGSASIHDMVLVAPAHEPDPLLLDDYIARRDQHEGEVPQPANELCGADPIWRDRLRDSYRDLTNRGVHVHVVYSPDDTFANYQPAQLPPRLSTYYHVHPMTPELLLTRLPGEPTDADFPKAEVAFHMRLRDDPEIKVAVAGVIRTIRSLY